MKQGPAEYLISAEAADGGAQQRQVLPALSVAPQAVVGSEQKLGHYNTSIQQQHIFREAAPGAYFGIGQQHCDPLVADHRQQKQQRVTEKQQLLTESTHDNPPKWTVLPFSKGIALRLPSRRNIFLNGKDEKTFRHAIVLSAGKDAAPVPRI